MAFQKPFFNEIFIASFPVLIHIRLSSVFLQTVILLLGKLKLEEHTISGQHVHVYLIYVSGLLDIIQPLLYLVSANIHSINLYLLLSYLPLWDHSLVYEFYTFACLHRSTTETLTRITDLNK